MYVRILEFLKQRNVLYKIQRPPGCGERTHMREADKPQKAATNQRTVAGNVQEACHSPSLYGVGSWKLDFLKVGSSQRREPRAFDEST